MSSLREDHPYLYRRVLLKPIVHILLGLILVFIPTQASSVSQISLINWFGLLNLGIIYLLIGLIIGYGLFKPNHTYVVARLGLRIAAYFNLLIFIGLLTVFFRNNTTASFIVIYGYLTYNIFHVLKDPGWKAISIVKNITNRLEHNNKMEDKHGLNTKITR